jgi:hypothetical protein
MRRLVVYFLSPLAVLSVCAAIGLPAGTARAYYDSGSYYGSGYYHSAGPAYRSYAYPGVRVYQRGYDSGSGSYSVNGHFVYVNGVAYWDNGSGGSQYYYSQNQYQGPGYRCYPDSGSAANASSNFSFQGHIAYTSDGTAYWQDQASSYQPANSNSCP